MSRTEPWLVWDTAQLVKDWVDAQLADQKFHPGAFDEIKSEEELYDEAYQDPELYEMAWEAIIEHLTDWMDGHKDWHVEGENMGWRHISGEAFFHARDGQELIRGFFPRTQEYTFKVWKEEDALVFHVKHHDAPVSPEIYTVARTKAD